MTANPAPEPGQRILIEAEAWYPPGWSTPLLCPLDPDGKPKTRDGFGPKAVVWHPANVPPQPPVLDNERLISGVRRIAASVEAALPFTVPDEPGWNALSQAHDDLRALVGHAGQADMPGDFESWCRRCGGPNVVWSAPSPLWNQVMRGGDINAAEPYDGVVCPTCFARLAEEQGTANSWRLWAQQVNVPLNLTTPSGRVWDERAWLWREPTPTDPPCGHRSGIHDDWCDAVNEYEPDEPEPAAQGAGRDWVAEIGVIVATHLSERDIHGLNALALAERLVAALGLHDLEQAVAERDELVRSVGKLRVWLVRGGWPAGNTDRLPEHAIDALIELSGDLDAARRELEQLRGENARLRRRMTQLAEDPRMTVYLLQQRLRSALDAGAPATVDGADQ